MNVYGPLNSYNTFLFLSSASNICVFIGQETKNYSSLKALSKLLPKSLLDLLVIVFVFFSVVALFLLIQFSVTLYHCPQI